MGTTARRMMGASLALLCLLGLGAQAGAKTLTPFKSEADLKLYLSRLPHRPLPPPPAPPPPMAGADAAAPVTVTAARASGSITNNQEANVDEGDIVKQHGDTLVVLRRGRLFTISTARGALTPVDAINAYPPGVNASGDWYDEMLVSGDRVIVIGYSYSRGGTQVDRFHIDASGHLKFEDAYQLRSNDYYSSTNYASRLVGHRLIVYTPLYLPYVGMGNALDMLPAFRKWDGSGTAPGFKRIGTAREIYLPPDLPGDQIAAIHTVMSCDVTSANFDCKATSVLGPDGRSFYVSEHAVYVWLTPYWGEHGPGKRASSMVYRLPLDGSAPSAVGVRGAPVDQFSFREDAHDNVLNVLVRADAAGDAMWTSHFTGGSTALLRLPLSAFGDGLGEVTVQHYRELPAPGPNFYDFHNRFVGDYVLYGSGNGWGTPQNGGGLLNVAPVHGGPVVQLKLPHGIDRIEPMGGDAVVVGSDANNVYFSAVDLGSKPALGDRYALTGAAQSETRSHGFFFKPEAGAQNGVLGLPVTRPAAPGYSQLFDSAAAMIYLRRVNGKFEPLGELGAHVEGAVDDHCVASCTDWYGNARPIFMGDRTLALMGYELVEGTLSRKTINEKNRVNFAPAR